MSSLLVEYDEAVLHEMRVRAVEGSQAMPFGGLEIGAVLFGSRSANHLHIKASLPIACEHAKGPGLLLSKRDEEALAGLLHGAAEDPALAGMLPLGWLRSTRRQTPHLSADDIAIHDAFFHEPWQVVLVMKPRVFGASRVAVFVRDSRGTLAAESPAQEFQVEAPATALSPRTERPAFGEGRSRHSESTEAAPAAAPVIPRLPELPPMPPLVPVPPPPRKRFRAWMMAVAMIAVVIAAGGFSLYVRGKASQVAPVPLRMEQELGQLTVSWNPHAAAVQQATGGRLQIQDGETSREIPLDRAALFGGSTTYVPSGANVTVKLHIDTPSGPVEQSSRFLGPEGSKGTPETTKQIEDLIRERDTLKAEVRSLTERALFAERQLERIKGGGAPVRAASRPPAMRAPVQQAPQVGPRP